MKVNINDTYICIYEYGPARSDFYTYIIVKGVTQNLHLMLCYLLSKKNEQKVQ